MYDLENILKIYQFLVNVLIMQFLMTYDKSSKFYDKCILLRSFSFRCLTLLMNKKENISSALRHCFINTKGHKNCFCRDIFTFLNNGIKYALLYSSTFYPNIFELYSICNVQKETIEDAFSRSLKVFAFCFFNRSFMSKRFCILFGNEESHLILYKLLKKRATC